jgi:diphthine-ammonia ligase
MESDEQEAHPECTALASGAILSNYQRLRIEHVCARLGLVSISYLWQATQLPLLERMLECGMEVILVKVAGVGLGIDLVGKNLREIMPLLRRLVSHIPQMSPEGEILEKELIPGITIWLTPSGRRRGI